MHEGTPPIVLKVWMNAAQASLASALLDTLWPRYPAL